jgi:CDP-diglyceride synthetase
MLDKFLCNPKNCIQSTVYIIGQTLWLTLYVSLFMGLYNAKKGNFTLILEFLRGFLLVVVMAVLIYMLINYLCNIDYEIIAWLLAIMPYIPAVIIGYNIPKYLKNII